VLEAKDIKAMDIGGTSDPFVDLEYAQQRYRSRVVFKTLYPVWLQETTFSYVPNTHLSVSIYDKDKLSRDDKVRLG